MPTSTTNATLKMVKATKHVPVFGRKYTMFQHEMSLPRLPVPPLQQTMEKYLLSVKPLLTDEEFACTKTAVEEFRKPSGVGELLQEKLVSRSNKMENWLAQWWDDVAYLGYENPVVVHSSPGIAFPRQNFASKLDQLRYNNSSNEILTKPNVTHLFLTHLSSVFHPFSYSSIHSSIHPSIHPSTHSPTHPSTHTLAYPISIH